MDHLSRERLRAVLPAWVSHYAEGSSIPQLINYSLLGMAVCNFFLFFGSLRASMLPNPGINALLLSFLLSSQNIIAWIVLNNHRMPPSFLMQFPSLGPSDFMVGVILGTSLGGSILSFVLSLFYGHMSKCHPSQKLFYPCEHKGNMLGIWFWSGLIFWLDLGVAVLVAIGRDELTQHSSYHHSYETIGVALDEMENGSNNVSSPANPFQQSYPMMASGYSSAAGNHTHEPLGEARFSTPSQESSRLQQQQQQQQKQQQQPGPNVQII